MQKSIPSRSQAKHSIDRQAKPDPANVLTLASRYLARIAETHPTASLEKSTPVHSPPCLAPHCQGYPGLHRRGIEPRYPYSLADALEIPALPHRGTPSLPRPLARPTEPNLGSSICFVK